MEPKKRRREGGEEEFSPTAKAWSGPLVPLVPLQPGPDPLPPSDSALTQPCPTSLEQPGNPPATMALPRPAARWISTPLVNYPVFFSRSFASRRAPSITDDADEDWQAARAWSAKLNPATIPRSICEISFSRSSGPGGQNVNKFVSRGVMVISARRSN